MSFSARRGIVMQSVLTSVVLGLVGLGSTGAWRVRQSACQIQARQEALRDAVFAGESALEEAVARLRHPAPGTSPVDPSERDSRSVEPIVTRAELARSRAAEHVRVSAVSLEPRGKLIEEDGKPAQGVLDLTVTVRAGRASLFGAAVSRRLVRRYRYQIFRARNAGGTLLYAETRLHPEPLAQWVAE